jgi:tetratricopeptide (TPR) repeat protein
MLGKILIYLLLILSMPLQFPSPGWSKESPPAASLFEGMGDSHFPITTMNARAQLYFDQGLVLAYAFNHAEAARSFREAARLDPQCAMCFWGVALVLGPNLNAPMEGGDVKEAYHSIQVAMKLAKSATEKEKELVEALSKRYAPKAIKDRKPLDEAYAEAMRQVANKYPKDATVLALTGEALMDLHPWDFWTKEKEAKPWTAEILTLLESALEIDPKHPLTNHLYIHAVEAGHPDRAELSADRLRDRVPGAGHLQHMPAHIYINIGRYRDAAIANQKAIEADQAYLRQVKAEGLYPLGYVPHNYHFLWEAAMMEGKSQVAMEAAEGTADSVDQTKMQDPGFGGTLQHFYTMPLYALARFGKWQTILREQAPPKELQYHTAIWHYARGLAFNAQGQPKEAASELAHLQKIVNDPEMARHAIFGINKFKNLLEIGIEVLEGEISAKKKDYGTAIQHLEKAVEIEDGLTYNEPSDWYFPPRQALGAVLLEAGQPARAEQVYLEDLKENRENGWSLYGLNQSLKDQGKKEAAHEAKKRFKKAWSGADIKISSSRF